MLQNTKVIKRSQFIKEVYEEGIDTFLFIFTTAVEDQTQRMVASKVNDLAGKFEQMNIKTVNFVSFDVNVENSPPRIESHETPSIYFMPAYKKTAPYLRFLGNPKIAEMGAFIKKHASI